MDAFKEQPGTVTVVTTLFTSLLLVLREKGVLTSNEARGVIEVSLSALEEHDSQEQNIRNARQMLERMLAAYDR